MKIIIIILTTYKFFCKHTINIKLNFPHRIKFCTLIIFSNAGTSLIPPVQTGSGTANLVAVFSSTIIIVCAISSILFLSIGYACGWFSQKHKKSRTSKAEDEKSSEGSQLPPTPGPLYEELQQRSTPEHQDLVELKENVAYGPIIK